MPIYTSSLNRKLCKFAWNRKIIASRKPTNKNRQGSKPTGGIGKAVKTLAKALKGNVNTMNQSFKPRRKKEVNINTNFSMFNKGRSGQDKGILIDKTEPVGVIASDGSGGFHICYKFALNPGQAKTFPILSQEAKVYEKYVFEELEFFTVPLVSEYALGGQQGETSLAINFNPALPPPASQTATLSLKPYDANLPCLPLKIRCSKSDLTQTTAMFVRSGGLPGNSDIKTYDVGNLYVTCEGLYETPFNICRLFVRYKCRLFNRVVLTDQGSPQNMSCAYFQTEYGGQTLSASGAHDTALFPVVTCNGIGMIGMSSGILTFTGSGNYNIDIMVSWIRAASAGVGDDIHYARATLYLNGQPSYPNIVFGGTFETTSMMQYTSTITQCLAIKENDALKLDIWGHYGGVENNVKVTVGFRITAV